MSSVDPDTSLTRPADPVTTPLTDLAAALGARLLGEAIGDLSRRGIIEALSWFAPAHEAVILSLGVADHLYREGRVFEETPEAIAWARELLRKKLENGIVKAPRISRSSSGPTPDSP